MSIEVLPYNPAWKAQFEQLKELFMQQLGPLIDGVEHVGSTSVPGLAAKPIIDIDLVIADVEKLPAVTIALEEMGYRALGDLGIIDRYAFRPAGEPAQSWPRHNLYCCIEGCVSLQNHRTLRRVLTDDPALREEYARIKRELATQTDDIDTYLEGKSAFIARLLSENGFPESTVATIVEQNRKQ